MAGLGNLTMEEGYDVSDESTAMLLDAEEAAPMTRLHLREKSAWRLAALGATLLALSGLASLALLRKHPGLHVSALEGVEQKFYDGSGSYWQAPGRAISTSELWGSCEHPHMHICKGYCCCDEEFYWNSPKTVYQQGEHVLKKAAGTAVEESSKMTADEAGVAIKDAAKELGKAALSSVVSRDQKCVPKVEAPTDVVKALGGNDPIPGSDLWIACSTFTSHSHTCGSYCCCNGGFDWSKSNEACLSS